MELKAPKSKPIVPKTLDFDKTHRKVRKSLVKSGKEYNIEF